MKVKHMFAGVVSLHVFDIVLTVLILMASVMIMDVRDNHLQYLIPGAETAVSTELEALLNNVSYIFKPEAYPKVLDNIRHKYQREIIQAMNKSMSALLFDKMSVIHPQYAVNLTMKNFERNLSDEFLDAIAETALSTEEYQDIWPKFHFSLHLRDILVSFSKGLHYHSDDSVYTKASRKRLAYYFDQFNVSDAIISYKISSVASARYFFNIICAPKTVFSLLDVNVPISLLAGFTSEVVENPLYPACQYTSVFDTDCPNTPLAAQLKKITGNLLPHEKVYHYAAYCGVVASLLYLLLDLLERCYFVYTRVANAFHGWQIGLVTLGTKVPGSYLRKQMNMLSICLFLSSMITFKWYYSGQFDGRIPENLRQYLCIVSLVLRFIMHIHSMRLLPGIGHFVVTTFMMGCNLLNFSVVFTIVVFIFSAIFHMILINPQCPLENLAGFQSLLESMFSTFRLTFGHGDVTNFYSNFPAKVTYVLYIVIMGLLLMNLIIGIMSSTATDVMQEPWRKTLWCMEWLEEALSTEFTYTVLGLSCRRCCKCNYIRHRNAGYVVERGDDGKYKIYIPILKHRMLQ